MQRAAVPYDAEDPEHKALLRELWEAAFPGEEFAVPSRRWKDMGWQGTDPATDFRGGGLMALQNLVYMAHRKPQLFDTLLHKKQGERAADTPFELGGRGGEYPCGAAGVNFTHMLIEMLQLRNTEQWPTSAEGIGFAPMLEEAAPVFDELYCAVFAQFDDMWL
eukprot:jgi/Astpho2/5132/gw1.00073.40.1_t